MSRTELPLACATQLAMRALSSTPDKPNTRSRGQPVCLNARYVSTSTGLLTSSSIALGACRITLSTTERDTARLASRNCSRLMPSLRGRPAVMITSSEPASSAGSAPPLTWVSKTTSGAGSCMSSAMPRATPSSMPSNTSSRHSVSFARICAVDSPTRPGPTMAIFFKATSFRTAHRDDERRRMFCKVGRRGTRQARRFFFRYNRRRALGRLREHSLLHAIQLLRLPLRLSAAGAAPVSRPAAARPRTRRGLHARGDVARLLRLVELEIFIAADPIDDVELHRRAEDGGFSRATSPAWAQTLADPRALRQSRGARLLQIRKLLRR